MSVDGCNLQAISWVLGTSCHNLSCVVEHWQLIQYFGLLAFAFLKRRKKQDGLSIETKRVQ